MSCRSRRVLRNGETACHGGGLGDEATKVLGVNRVEIEQHLAERSLYAQQWEAVVEELRAAGYVVGTREPIERRDAAGMVSLIGGIVSIAQAAGLDDVRRVLLRHLRGNRMRDQAKRVV